MSDRKTGTQMDRKFYEWLIVNEKIKQHFVILTVCVELKQGFSLLLDLVI